MSRCRTTTHGDLSIEACLDDGEVRYTAMRGDGEVGVAVAEPYGKHYIVKGIEVDQKVARGRVGTRLYEAIVKDACAAQLRVASDHFRSHFAEAFWRKQATKGRATCQPGDGEVYAAPLERLKKLRAQHLIDAEDFAKRTEGLPTPVGGRWPCVQYVVPRPCAVPSLEGVRRKRRPR